jgi:hypothetical protein
MLWVNSWIYYNKCLIALCYAKSDLGHTQQQKRLNTTMAARKPISIFELSRAVTMVLL